MENQKIKEKKKKRSSSLKNRRKERQKSRQNERSPRQDTGETKCGKRSIAAPKIWRTRKKQK